MGEGGSQEEDSGRGFIFSSSTWPGLHLLSSAREMSRVRVCGYLLPLGTPRRLLLLLLLLHLPPPPPKSAEIQATSGTRTLERLPLWTIAKPRARFSRQLRRGGSLSSSLSLCVPFSLARYQPWQVVHAPPRPLGSRDKTLDKSVASGGIRAMMEDLYLTLRERSVK